MSLPIICYLSRLPLFLVFIMWGMRSRGRVGHSEGPFIPGLQSAKTPRDRGRLGGGGQKRNVCSEFVPQSLFSPSVQFSLCSRNAGKMDASIRPLFFTCAERKSQCFVTELWLRYQHVSKSRLRGMLCGVIKRSIFWLTGAVPKKTKKTTAAVKERGCWNMTPPPPSQDYKGWQWQGFQALEPRSSDASKLNSVRLYMLTYGGSHISARCYTFVRAACLMCSIFGSHGQMIRG